MKVREPVRQKWTRYQGIAEGGRVMRIDAEVRPLFQHTAREIQKPFLQRIDRGGVTREEVPEEMADDYGAAIADHMIIRLGSPGTVDEDAPREAEKDRRFGLEVDMTEDGLLVAPTMAANYGVPTLTPGIEGLGITEQPWPMTPEGKYALISIFSEFGRHITDFAKEIAKPVGPIVTPERQEQDNENLGPTPSSEQSSPSATAGEEE